MTPARYLCICLICCVYPVKAWLSLIGHALQMELGSLPNGSLFFVVTWLHEIKLYFSWNLTVCSLSCHFSRWDSFYISSSTESYAFSWHICVRASRPGM
jgi:hypothetical protein